MAGQQKSAALAQSLYDAISQDMPLSRIESLVRAGADLEAPVGSNRYTALLWALMGDKHVETALYLVDAGADPYAFNGLGNALTYAALYGRDQRKLDGMLDRGVKPDVPFAGGKTALMCAAEQEQEWAVIKLLQHGANPFKRDDSGLCARDYAYKKGAEYGDRMAALFEKWRPDIQIMKPPKLKRPAP